MILILSYLLIMGLIHTFILILSPQNELFKQFLKAYSKIQISINIKPEEELKFYKLYLKTWLLKLYYNNLYIKCY